MAGRLGAGSLSVARAPRVGWLVAPDAGVPMSGDDRVWLVALTDAGAAAGRGSFRVIVFCLFWRSERVLPDTLAWA